MSLLATSRMWQASYGAVPVQGSFLATQIQLLPWEECGAGVIVHEVRPRSIPKANGTLLPKLSTTWRESRPQPFRLLGLPAQRSRSHGPRTPPVRAPQPRYPIPSELQRPQLERTQRRPVSAGKLAVKSSQISHAQHHFSAPYRAVPPGQLSAGTGKGQTAARKASACQIPHRFPSAAVPGFHAEKQAAVFGGTTGSSPPVPEFQQESKEDQEEFHRAAQWAAFLIFSREILIQAAGREHKFCHGLCTSEVDLQEKQKPTCKLIPLEKPPVTARREFTNNFNPTRGATKVVIYIKQKGLPGAGIRCGDDKRAFLHAWYLSGFATGLDNQDTHPTPAPKGAEKGSRSPAKRFLSCLGPARAALSCHFLPLRGALGLLQQPIRQGVNTTRQERLCKEQIRGTRSLTREQSPRCQILWSLLILGDPTDIHAVHPSTHPSRPGGELSPDPQLHLGTEELKTKRPVVCGAASLRKKAILSQPPINAASSTTGVV
ncbi:hypothetical protein Anapl_10714 [Anas platyrhynchos]|uniref:Uncharacterized protein n=1 Tax=Anas platyrhynchos TaxID=8839 RepID=R0LP58_ANAPL|nr:hypothetical protein Anapl_10714 [Anas platyrhynchos]